MWTLLYAQAAGAGETAEKTTDHKALLGVGIVGLVVLGLQVAVLLRKKQGFGQTNFKMWGLSLVLVAGLAMLLIDTTEGHAIAAWGLLGVIAGYSFGKSGEKEPPSQ